MNDFIDRLAEIIGAVPLHKRERFLCLLAMIAAALAELSADEPGAFTQ